MWDEAVRRRGLAVASAIVGAVVPGSLAAEKPVEIGDRRQVFIDGRYLAKKQGVRIVVCPPRKTGEKCLSSASRHDGGWLRGYGNVMEVDGTFKGYDALSKDGAHFRRMERGTPPEPDDIVGYRNGMAVVFRDPSAPAEARYKLANPKAGWVKASADGTDWRTVARDMFPPEARYPRGMDSQNVIFFDRRLGKYVAYVRVNKTYPAPPERRDYFAKLSKRITGEAGSYPLRTVGRSVSEDLSSFPMPKVVFEPDKQDPRYGGVGVLDFYMPNVIPYRRAQDAYFLFTPRYLHYESWYLSEDLSGYPRSGADTLNTGPEDIGFAASRNGVDWRRYARRPWIPLGMEGRFDSKNMYPARGLVVRDQEIWMYYTGYDTLHGNKDRSARRPTISRVVLRKDGFTAVEADYDGGSFTTPPLRFDGAALHLNVNTSAPGTLRVAIQDASGEPLPGYTMDDCDRVHTANTVDRVVTWNGEADVSDLADRPVRLRFELNHGVKLYTFRFGAAQP